MSWQIIKWYKAHRVRRDEWDRIMLIVVVAALILILGRYPLYIRARSGPAFRRACGVALVPSKNSKMRLS
jgi:hypothetical protein